MKLEMADKELSALENRNWSYVDGDDKMIKQIFLPNFDVHKIDLDENGENDDDCKTNDCVSLLMFVGRLWWWWEL